jgi:very-short-patch-repair endonuclease
MYDKSQIQNEKWNDDSYSSNIGTELGNSDKEKELRTCKCGEIAYSIRALSFHKNKCELVLREKAEQTKKDLEAGLLIKCALCDEIGSSLALHVRKVHQIDKKEYIQKYGPVLSNASKNKYCEVNKDNSNWIARAKQNGEDLSEYWDKVSKGVSKAIMESPKERERRSKLLGDLNKTDSFRRRASETAKKTSARPDILHSRSSQLKRWRDNNKELHYKLCTANMHKFKSKPEKLLFNFVSQNYSNLEFKNNQFLNDEAFKTFNKPGNKQIDILSLDKSIIIEYDGFLHFKEIWNGSLEVIKKKDLILSSYCLNNKITLIRVSCDNFSYKKNSGFSSISLEKIKEIIENPITGVHFIGKSWNGSEYTFVSKKEELENIYK